MIKTEIRTINGREFNYTYSDAGMMIERDHVKYSEAYDPIDVQRIYTETTEPIMTEEMMEAEEAKHHE